MGVFSNLTISRKNCLVDGSFALLEILALLNDPCPKWILTRLVNAIDVFKQCVVSLVEGKHGKMTSKLHELFEHVVDQIQSGGMPINYGSKILETFHHGLVDSYNRTSKRNQGQSLLELIESVQLKRYVKEARKSRETLRVYDRLLQWKPFSCFRVAGNFPSFEDCFNSSLFSFNANFTLFDLACLDLNYRTLEPLISNNFSQKLFYVNKCSNRNVDISRVESCSVPFVNKGKYENGAISVLVFESLNRKFVLPSNNCSVSGCRHHDYQHQLFCSAARDLDNEYGYPLVFCDSFAVVIKLAEKKIISNSAIVSLMSFGKLERVEYSRVRGDRMAFSLGEKGELFVFCGRYPFGFNDVT